MEKDFQHLRLSRPNKFVGKTWLFLKQLCQFLLTLLKMNHYSVIHCQIDRELQFL